VTEQQVRTIKSDRWSYLWLALGAILLLFANGRWIIPLAAWLAGVFIMRFLRTQKPVRGLILVLLASIVVTIVAWQGMIPVPGVFYYLVAAGIGTTIFLPYLADRLIAPRLNGFASTLVFPLAWAVVEYLNSLASPYGTWGALAYTQVNNLPLIQLVSVTGIWGLAFLIAWFASVINWAWERQFEWKKVRAGAMLYVGTLVLVLLFGGARVSIRQAISSYGLGTRFGRGWLDRLLGQVRYLPRPMALSLRNTFRRKARVALTLLDRHHRSAWLKCQRYFVERANQDSKSEAGWDELQALKYRGWEHHLALVILATWFVAQIKWDWAEKYTRDPTLARQFDVQLLPALSMANIRTLLRAAMPLPQNTPEEATARVVEHLVNRTRSRKNRLKRQKASPSATAPP